MSSSTRETLSDLFVEPAWLAQHLSNPNIRVVEVDVSRTAYAEGHIPGAVLWNAYTDLHRDEYRPLERGEVENLLSKSGIAPDDTAIFYGYGRPLGAWFLKAYAHPRALMLNISRTAWRDAALPWTT
ncbi:MAG: rhodanese-like domain-containing protein, partial [Ktedonobacterales bacterium]